MDSSEACRAYNSRAVKSVSLPIRAYLYPFRVGINLSDNSLLKLIGLGKMTLFGTAPQ